MTQPSFSTRGVIDLGALRSAPPMRPAGTPVPPGGARPSGPPSAAGSADGASGYVLDVTEGDFQTVVLEQSMTAPVVIDFWASWCGPCKTLSPILERLAQADGGRWLLAKVDVDANQRLAGAFGVQSIPSVFAVVKGQPVPLFQGALPEQQVRQYLDEVLRIAAANGVAGRVGAPASPEQGYDSDQLGAVQPTLPPRIAEALDAVERGDLDAGAAAYRAALAETPGEPMAREGLAQVELLRRAETLDLAGAIRTADEHPDDVAAQCAAADAEVLSDRVEAAFARLVDTVRRSAGAEREQARAHLLGLFDVVGAEDPRVPKARTALANALF